MTIKEIAALAGVSTSTVSKIVNEKDGTINPETRERVLKIVKEYNYSPYSSIKSVSTSKTFLLGLMINYAQGNFELLDGIMEHAQENGYRVIVCESRKDLELELKNVLQLCKYNVDGVIWEKVSAESSAYEKYFEEIQAPVCEIAEGVETGGRAQKYSIDFEKLGSFATRQLIQKMHTSIVFVSKRDDIHLRSYLNGYRQALFENNIRETLINSSIYT